MATQKTEQAIIIQQGKELMQKRQAEFRSNVQQLINDNMQRMQEILNTLDAKEFLDTFIKLLPYGYAKAPEEKPKEQQQPHINIEKAVLAEKLTT